MEFDPELLALAVEERPLLYNKLLPEYSNKILKEKAWMEVAQALTDDWDNITSTEKGNKSKEAQSKWKNLRDNFRRELQAQKKVTSGEAAKKRAKYRFFDQLSFLIPFISDGNSSGNYKSPTHNDSQTENLSDIAADTSPPQLNDNAQENDFTPKKIQKMKTSFEDNLIKAINDKTTEEEDEDKTFCKSLVPSLKKLNDSDKLQAKIDILSVFHRISTRNNNQSTVQQPLTQTIQQPFTRTAVQRPSTQTIQQPFNHTTVQQPLTQIIQQPFTPTAVQQPSTQTIQQPFNHTTVQQPLTQIIQQPFTHTAVQQPSTQTIQQPITHTTVQQPFFYPNTTITTNKKIKILNYKIRPPTSSSHRPQSAQSYFSLYTPTPDSLHTTATATADSQNNSLINLSTLEDTLDDFQSS